MQTVKRIRKCLGVFLIAGGLLACGGNKQQTPTKETTSTAKTPSTEKSTIKEEVPEEVSSPPQLKILEKVPSSTFLAITFSKPSQSLKLLQEFLTKSGIMAVPDFQKELAQFRTEVGVDPFDSESIQKTTGIDMSKGMVFGIDGELVSKDPWFSEYAGTVEFDREPAPYMVFSLKDPKAFDTWIRASLQKVRSSPMTFEEDTIGEAKVVYTLVEKENYSSFEKPAPPPSGSAPVAPTKKKTTKELMAAMVTSGEHMYFFFLDVDESPAPQVPDTIAAFKSDLNGFLQRVSSSSIGKNPSFQDATKRVAIEGDSSLFLSLEGFASFQEKFGAPEVIFLPPKTPDQQRAQDDEKGYLADRGKRRAEEAAMFTSMGKAFPAFVINTYAKSDGITMKGVGIVGASHQGSIEKMLSPSKEMPSYSTLFSENTSFVYRLALEPAAFKAFISEMLGPKERAEFDRDITGMSAELGKMGLDLEKDILGAFTGHFALASPSLQTFGMYFLMAGPGGPTPSIPPVAGVAQLTSEAAGDKLLTAINTLAKSEGMVLKKETVGKDTLYTSSFGPFGFGVGRTGELLVAGIGIENVKKIITQAQSPKDSFVEKLSGSVAKELLQGKNLSGGTANLGDMFTWISSQPGVSGDERQVMTQLGTFLDQITMYTGYENGAIQMQGEIVLK